MYKFKKAPPLREGPNFTRRGLESKQSNFGIITIKKEWSRQKFSESSYILIKVLVFFFLMMLFSLELNDFVQMLPFLMDKGGWIRNPKLGVL